MTSVQIQVGDRFAAYWTALVKKDPDRAFEVVRDSLAEGASVSSVLEELVATAQRRVGRLWACNDWTVAQEHSVSAISESVVQRLHDALPVPTGPALLVSTAEREWHDLPAQVLSAVLRSHGYADRYLGPNAGALQLAGTIEVERPAAVLLSASLSSSLYRLRRQVEACRSLGVPVLVGGQAFDEDGERARRLGATGFARTPDDVLDLLERLPAHTEPAPPLEHPSALEARAIAAESNEIARDALRTAGEHLGIDRDAAAVGADDWRVVMATFVPYVIDCLTSALLVEDPVVMRETRVWRTDVLVSRSGDDRAAEELWEALAFRLRHLPLAVGALHA